MAAGGKTEQTGGGRDEEQDRERERQDASTVSCEQTQVVWGELDHKKVDEKESECNSVTLLHP